MPFALTMPKLSPTMTEGVIAKWHKKPGEYAEVGDLLLEISTDKATIEHNALDPGWMKKILKQEGEKAAVNEPLALFSVDKDESVEGFSLQQVAQPKAQEAPALKAITASLPKHEESGRIIASPLAKKLAKEHNIELLHVTGTGPRGRIMSRDLKEATSVAPQQKTQTLRPQKQEAITPLGPTPYAEESISPLRKVIGQRLQASKSYIPHFYIRQEIDASALFSLREDLKKQQVSCTINDFIIKATATALTKHPEVNCGFNEEKQTLIRYSRVDLSIAVTIPGGLITPIVTAANTRTLTDISSTVKELAAKAKEGKLLPEEFQGGSFTISNLGMYGISSFDAIVNPPQGAILAVGAVADAPVVRNGQVVPGKVMTLTLSCDHRIIDGAEAAQFMKTLKELLEHPLLCLVH